jgi:hypothetical protein
VAILYCMLQYKLSLLYRPIAGPSGPRQVDLPVQDSEKDDGQAYKMYARVVREGG